ncbi:MAG TPA: PhzF family phenazine biosynthesis protein [Vicinamibacterales bacterium]|jgi:PhzF family phenazine biosynthesis protein
MPTRLYQVDAFTDRPFAGNPAAVCLLDRPADAVWMQSVAREMNLSETAFVVPGIDAAPPNCPLFGLRWFTAAGVEVDICGHATLATAHVLWESGLLAHGERACFDTRSGRLTAARDAAWITLDFPAMPVVPGPIPGTILTALRVDPLFTGTCGPRCLVEVANESIVRGLAPDFTLMRSAPGRAVIVTSRADAGRAYDIVSRYFAPWVGVDEDPVTGVAHCALGPFWAARLGRQTVTAYQASARGGHLRLALTDGLPPRVQISGQAVTVLVGTLRGA